MAPGYGQNEPSGRFLVNYPTTVQFDRMIDDALSDLEKIRRAWPDLVRVARMSSRIVRRCAACAASSGLALVGTPSFSLGANASNVAQTLANALSMSNSSDTACQGKTFNVNLTTSASS